MEDQQGHVNLPEIAAMVGVFEEVFEDVLAVAHHDDEVHLVLLDVFGQQLIDVICGYGFLDEEVAVVQQFFSEGPGGLFFFLHIYVVQVRFKFEAHAQDAALHNGIELLVFSADDEDVVDGAEGKVGRNDEHGAGRLRDDAGGFGADDLLESAVSVFFPHADEPAAFFFAGLDDLLLGLAFAQHEADALGNAVLVVYLSKFGELVPGAAFLETGYPAGSAEKGLRLVHVQDAEIHLIGLCKFIRVSEGVLGFPG